MFEASNISFQIGKKRILNDVSLRLAPGKVTAVAGPNGAGKSTLLKVFSGEISPTHGAVTLDQVTLKNWQPLQLAMRRAVMSQHSKVNFHFSAIEVVLIGRSPHQEGRLETTQDWELAYSAMKQTGVEHLAERPFPVLSGGEQQRVQLARALVQIWSEQVTSPRYLLLDEPTASLDLSHQHQTLRLARELAESGVGVLAILHDLNLVARYADEVMLLAEGRSLASGKPDEVLTEETIEKVFEVKVAVRRDPEAGIVVMVL